MKLKKNLWLPSIGYYLVGIELYVILANLSIKFCNGEHRDFFRFRKLKYKHLPKATTYANSTRFKNLSEEL